MGVLIWILRALAVLLLLRFVLRALFGPRRTPGGGARTRGGAAPERLGGELVRDPHCGTYIPKSRAIVVGSGPDTQYFCSTKCRDAHGSSKVDP